MYLRDWIEHIVLIVMVFTLYCAVCLGLVWFALTMLLVAVFSWLPSAAPVPIPV